MVNINSVQWLTKKFRISNKILLNSRSILGSEIYERLPDSGSQADDLDERVGSDEFIGSRITGGHESDVYSSLDRTGENGEGGMGTGSTERLVRPSQMKKNKQGKKNLRFLVIPTNA